VQNFSSFSLNQKIRYTHHYARSATMNTTCISKYSLHVTFRAGLDNGEDFFIGGRFLQSAYKANNGNINCWHMESHTC
jgi:hypothetical protein